MMWFVQELRHLFQKTAHTADSYVPLLWVINLGGSSRNINMWSVITTYDEMNRKLWWSCLRLCYLLCYCRTSTTTRKTYFWFLFAARASEELRWTTSAEEVQRRSRPHRPEPGLQKPSDESSEDSPHAAVRPWSLWPEPSTRFHQNIKPRSPLQRQNLRNQWNVLCSQVRRCSLGLYRLWTHLFVLSHSLI